MDMEISFIHRQTLLHWHVNKTNPEREAKGLCYSNHRWLFLYRTKMADFKYFVPFLVKQIGINSEEYGK